MKSKTKTPTKRKVVKRHTRNYQFRDEHPIDQHIESVLDFWKHERREITTLRKAVALYYALEQGNLTELFDFFPQYKAQFAPDTASAIEEFMDILRKQSATNGAGQSIKYNPPIPLPAPPIAEIKQTSVSVSADDIADNFLSMFQ
ncbi:MAG: hypothetical protein H0X30_03705 [Anaerolineae bacterium]|nr:hypothetical protein [Anaerolineae bacterium]